MPLKISSRSASVTSKPGQYEPLWRALRGVADLAKAVAGRLRAAIATETYLDSILMAVFLSDDAVG